MRENTATGRVARPWQTQVQRSCGDLATIFPVLLDCPSLLHPDFQLRPPPVVVIGMHRSGTSLAAALLAAVGVYMGPEWARLTRRNAVPPLDDQLLQNGYAEAEDFRALNDRLLAGAGAAWNAVEPFLAVRDQPRFTRTRGALLRAATFGRLHQNYLGPLGGVDDRPWGWKDPRNSLTLPLWLPLFPEARVLHVRRDREAAAASLNCRAQAWSASPGPALPLRQRARQWARHPWRTVRRAGQRLRLLPPAPPDPCLDLDYCRHLYDQYLQECLRFRRRGPRYLEVQYEEILADPLAAARRLADFAGCSPSWSRLQAARALVRREEQPRPAAGAGDEAFKAAARPDGSGGKAR